MNRSQQSKTPPGDNRRVAHVTDAVMTSSGKPPDSCETPTKVLNVEIPESVYWHVRRCATESRMSMKDFMSIFCKTASPITLADSETVSPQDHQIQKQ
jgi:hypothetical protein